MSKNNILLSMWLAQIRKVLSQSENSHLYLITQKIGRIDVALRDLAHWIIDCQKVMHEGKVVIIRRYYQGIEAWERQMVSKTTYFVGNKYFEYYDSYELVNFGESAYL